MLFVVGILSTAAEMPLYMRLPQGYKCNGMKRKTHTLKLLRNVYKNQAGRVWKKYMDHGMREIGFTPSKFDPCLYYWGSVVFLVYIEDSIVFGPGSQTIDQVVAWPQHFTVDDQDDVGDFLGIQVQKQED